MFVEWCEPEELNVPIENEDKEVRKEGFLGMKQNATMVAKYVGQQGTFTLVRHKWFAEFLGRELGKIYNCFIAETCKD